MGDILCGAWEGLSRPEHWQLCLAGGFDDNTLLTPCSSEDWRVWLINHFLLTVCTSSTSFSNSFIACCYSSLGIVGAGANGFVRHLPCWLWGLAPLQGTEQDLANATVVTCAPFFFSWRFGWTICETRSCSSIALQKMEGVGVVRGLKPPRRGQFYLLLPPRDGSGEAQGRFTEKNPSESSGGAGVCVSAGTGGLSSRQRNFRVAWRCLSRPCRCLQEAQAGSVGLVGTRRGRAGTCWAPHARLVPVQPGHGEPVAPQSQDSSPRGYNTHGDVGFFWCICCG